MSREEREKLKSPLSTEELFSALKDLKKDKSPGDDTLTKEFFVYFWNELKDLYIKCIIEINEKKELSNSQKRGLNTIVHKKMRDSF